LEIEQITQNEYGNHCATLQHLSGSIRFAVDNPYYFAKVVILGSSLETVNHLR